MNTNGHKNLEKLVIKYQKAGQDWVEAKLKADQLEEDQKSYLASLMNELDDGDKGESKLDRLARGSKQYRDYVASVCLARADMLRKKVRYDSMGMYFDAKRSELSFERETIKKGIFDQGK